jgi:OOP family OmpA-OmpF porin
MQHRRGNEIAVLSASMFVILLALSCGAASSLRGKLDGIKDVVDQAEANGAYTCAPVQLAMAKSHLKFARLELDEGYLSKAKKHAAISEVNAQEAYDLSPPEKCAPKELRVEVPTIPKVGDRDGDGCLDNEDPCPDDPEDFDGFEDDDCCPEDQDTDMDGIPDSSDVCVVEPEDKDGYLDGDGCPELDNDVDGILDDKDACPDDPEDPDGWQDDDGCPDDDNDADKIKDVDDDCPNIKGVPEENGCPKKYTGVVITDKYLKIMQKIFFEFNKAKIKPESFNILDEVVAVLKDRPEITLEIQGHTDDKGKDDYNLCLSQARAASVKKYLVEHGIASSRLTAVGYGETCFIASNKTKEGRGMNRRVEFMRTDVAEPDRPCPIPSMPSKCAKYEKKFNK